VDPDPGQLLSIGTLNNSEARKWLPFIQPNSELSSPPNDNNFHG